jgi:hypothetical protein
MMKKNLLQVRGLICSLLSVWLIKQVKGPADHRLLFRQSERDQYYYNPQITEIIFSFCHLSGNRLTVDNKKIH